MNVMKITPSVEQKPAVERLAAYCRVSSNSEDQLHSFAAQIRYFKNYAVLHPEYRLVGIYADEGITGTCMDKREEMLRMIRDCQKGMIDRVIAKSVSRFARNTEELLATIRLLKELGISVFFEEQNLDTGKLPLEMIVTFPGMAAQQESTEISSRMRKSYQMRMQTGTFNTCMPPYGYDMQDGQLIINSTEAEVVVRVFSLYLLGFGMQTIASTLNQENVPRRYHQKAWTRNSVRYILMNLRYTGDALLQRFYTPAVLPFKCKENHGQMPQYLLENANLPIISKETFQKAQELMKNRYVINTAKAGKYPLTGLLRCADCGHAFRRLYIRGKASWACSTRVSNATKCRACRVGEEAVYETFLIMMDKLKDHREEIIGDAIKAIEEMQSSFSSQNERIKTIDQKIADLSARSYVIVKLHNSSILSTADYSSQSLEINNQISNLRSQRRKILMEESTDNQLDDLRELYEMLEYFEPQNGFDPEQFQQAVASIMVMDNAQLRFRLHGGLELTESILESRRYVSA